MQETRKCPPATPNNSTGNRITIKEKNATKNVPPKTASALTETTRKGLETRAANTMTGRRPRTIEIAGNREITG